MIDKWIKTLWVGTVYLVMATLLYSVKICRSTDHLYIIKSVGSNVMIVRKSTITLALLILFFLFCFVFLNCPLCSSMVGRSAPFFWSLFINFLFCTAIKMTFFNKKEVEYVLFGFRMHQRANHVVDYSNNRCPTMWYKHLRREQQWLSLYLWAWS